MVVRNEGVVIVIVLSVQLVLAILVLSRHKDRDVKVKIDTAAVTASQCKQSLREFNVCYITTKLANVFPSLSLHLDSLSH